MAIIKIILRVLSFLAIVLLVYWTLNTEWFSILKSGDMDATEEYLSEERLTTLLITFVLMTIQNLFTLVPLVLIVGINILLFGFVLGFLWSWSTSLACSIIAFLLYRYWLQSMFSKRINEEIKDKIERNGFLFMLYARMIPFIPSSFINITAGASSIKFTHYIGATAIGNFVYMFIMCLIVNGIISAEIENYAIVIALIGLMPIIYFIQKRKTLKVKEKSNGEKGRYH